MFSFLPLACFAVVFLVFQKHQPFYGWRSSFLSAALVCGLLLTAITEFLGIFGLLNFWTVSGLWTVSIILAAVYLSRISHGLKNLNVGLHLHGISRFEYLLLAAVA